MTATTDSNTLVESPYAWWRLAAALLLSTIGGVGTWCVVVALPAVQVEFGSARGAASLPYTLTMIGFGFGGIMLGRWSDRVGAMKPVVVGAIILGCGSIVASAAGSLWQFAIAQGFLVGVGCSATFSPLLADTSRWFDRRRGIAVASSRAATTWRAPSGRRSCSTSSPARAGAPPMWAWACSSW